MNALGHEPTLALRRFIRGWLYDWSLLLVVNAHVPARAFEEFAAKHLPQGEPAAEADQIRQDFYRIMWSRLVDHFQTYLSTLLFTVFEARPELITRSAKAAGLKKVPSNARQAARRMHGFATYQRVFGEIGIAIPLSENDREVLGHAIEFRNLIVHAAGVDELGRFIEPPADSAGADLMPEVTLERLMAVEQSVRRVATLLDEAAVKMFGIGTAQ